MIELTKKERERARAAVLDMLSNHLPEVIPMPVPASIRSETWFRESGIGKRLRKYALPCGRMSGFNGKTPPAMKAWLMDEGAGKFKDSPIVIGATSGNWGMSSGIIAPLFDVTKFCAVIEKSTPRGKQKQLLTSGAEIIYAPDGISANEHAHQLATGDARYHLIDQYTHPGSILGHQWTMDHIAAALKRRNETPSLFGAVAGTCSTLLAADRFLKKGPFPDLKIFGVASMSREEKVPGSRSPEGLAELKRSGGFPYEEAIDFPLVTSITRREAYELTAEFFQRHFMSLGPTAALLEAGGFRLLKNHWETNGNFDGVANAEGAVVMVSLFMDMHLAYLDDAELVAAFAH